MMRLPLAHHYFFRRLSLAQRHSTNRKLSDKQFMEHTHSGYATLFTITISQPFERYEFDLENENIKGHWCGLLSERNGQTEIIFTETVFAKKWYLKPFVKTYLRKQQSVYLKDLRQKLLETVR